MKYSVQKLDGRFSHANRFQYFVGFSNSMHVNQGPESYNQALKWFTDTYGWSAEVHESQNIYQWYTQSVPFIKIHSAVRQPHISEQLPQCYNTYWSWSNHMSTLRIYVATDKELAFFQLNFPFAQK